MVRGCRSSGGPGRAVGAAHHPLTAPRISGNAASDKNIKDGVCAQIEKNFARAKWKVGGRSPVPQSPPGGPDAHSPSQKAVRVTTLMKRLRAPEQTESAPATTAATTATTATAATAATATTDAAAPLTPATPPTASPAADTCNGAGDAAAAALAEAPSEPSG